MELYLPNNYFLYILQLYCVYVQIYLYTWHSVFQKDRTLRSLLLWDKTHRLLPWFITLLFHHLVWIQVSLNFSSDLVICTARGIQHQRRYSRKMLNLFPCLSLCSIPFVQWGKVESHTTNPLCWTKLGRKKSYLSPFIFFLCFAMQVSAVLQYLLPIHFSHPSISLKTREMTALVK